MQSLSLLLADPEPCEIHYGVRFKGPPYNSYHISSSPWTTMSMAIAVQATEPKVSFLCSQVHHLG
jgi:hypothetical protein